MQNKSYSEIIGMFSARTVGVIGDMILDIYISSKPARLSREAPVIVLEFEEETTRPGGAANAVNNLCSLGVNAVAIGTVGDDRHGEELKNILSQNGAATDGLLLQKGFHTITKTRVLAGDLHTAKQQVLRIDRGKATGLDDATSGAALKLIGKYADKVDCWLVSDYGYGFLTKEIENALSDLASRALVIADSRYNVKEFPRITAVTPNESEALSFGRYFLNDETDIMIIGRQMLEILFLKYALITRGNQGMVVFEKGAEPVEIPIAGSEEIVDVSGAGDTVAATFGLSLACGATPVQAAKLANCAASVVVMKSGTATCSQAELLDAADKYL